MTCTPYLSGAWIFALTIAGMILESIMTYFLNEWFGVRGRVWVYVLALALFVLGMAYGKLHLF